MASRDVPAFPREERHHRAPAGTRDRRLWKRPGKRKLCKCVLHTQRERGGVRRVCIAGLFRTRSEISRDYPLNLSISLSGGKETNQDSPSNGE